jgi:replicative DNA helicase
MSAMDRLPPHNIEAEEALLGSLLIDPDALFDVASFLRPGAFYREANKWIYEAILDLNERREAVDFITLTDELRRREQLEELGGEGYLIGLINTVPTSINAASYGRIVEATALRRRMVGAASTIANLAYDEAEDVNIVIDRAEQALFSISEERTTRDLVPVRQLARAYLDRIEELHARGDEMIGVPTGFNDLDRILSGLNKSDLVIIAARPGMGKCVAADTLLVDPQTGALSTIEEIVRHKRSGVLTLTDSFKLQPARASHFVDDGVKPVYRVRTALGREIKVTLSHPFLTVSGWRRLEHLSVGDHVAVPRVIPVFGNIDAPEHEAKVLAYLLGDGCLTGTSPMFTNSNQRLREDFAAAALCFPGNKIRVEHGSGRRTPALYVTGDLTTVVEERRDFGVRLQQVMAEGSWSQAGLAREVGVASKLVSHWLNGDFIPSPENFVRLSEILSVAEMELSPIGIAAISRRNSLTAWLRQLEVWGKSASEKEVPEAVYRYTRSKTALFLNRLFACDGTVYLHKNGQPAISYSSVSLTLAQGVQHLLLRFGIIAKLRRRRIRYKGEDRFSAELRITAAESLAKFIEEIGAFGKEEMCARVRAYLSEKPSNTNLDTIPRDVWKQIEAAKGLQTWRSLYDKMGLPGGANIHADTRAPSRDRLLALGEALQSEELARLAQSDVYWDKIVEIAYLGEEQVYDLTVPETHNFVANDIIVHNTAFQNSIALNAARRHQKRVAIFNLEMSGEQLVQRMIAMETRIDSQRLRRGNLQEHEWPIFYEAIGRLSEARIFIDDTPSITPTQLRTKCRRLYAEHGLDLVMIDYLQLMQVERSTNNRVQEISEISRQLKGLARELDVPVLAAAQLSRAVEQRQDKRPMLSDLRDSGCLTGDTLIPLADSGRRVRLDNLMGQSGFKVWALNENTWRLEPATVSRAFSTGVRPVYRLTTRLGRTIRATANHPFRLYEGWRRLDEIKATDRLALPGSIPEELAGLATSDVYWDEVVSIEPDGEAEVYDLTVPGPHNFVANDIVAHNSIEQDADIVMFIYRDEYYHPDSTERPNIAEINIAKHRNGPTGAIDLYWHGQLATFRNLQRQEINL